MQITGTSSTPCECCGGPACSFTCESRSTVASGNFTEYGVIAAKWADADWVAGASDGAWSTSWTNEIPIYRKWVVSGFNGVTRLTGGIDPYINHTYYAAPTGAEVMYSSCTSITPQLVTWDMTSASRRCSQSVPGDCTGGGGGSSGTFRTCRPRAVVDEFSWAPWTVVSESETITELNYPAIEEVTCTNSVGGTVLCVPGCDENNVSIIVSSPWDIYTCAVQADDGARGQLCYSMVTNEQRGFTGSPCAINYRNLRGVASRYTLRLTGLTPGKAYKAQAWLAVGDVPLTRRPGEGEADWIEVVEYHFTPALTEYYIGDSISLRGMGYNKYRSIFECSVEEVP